MPGSHDPWLNSEPLPGVTFTHNERVEIISGDHAGETGWLVALILAAEPVYTVELESGGGDVDVIQSSLRRAA